MALPQSRFTVATLRDRIKGDLGLRSNNLLTDADLLAWGQEGQDLIARETRWAKTTANANSVADQREYDLPANVIGLEEVLYSTSGTVNTHLPMQLVTLSDLTTMHPFWRQNASGTPIFYYVRGYGQYGLHQTPSTSVTNGILLVYSYLPTLPTADGDTFSVPYGNGEAILAYCLYRGAMKDASGEGGKRVDAYWQQWQAALNDVKRAVESVSEGEACVMGADADGQFKRLWDNFNPSSSIPAPS